MKRENRVPKGYVTPEREHEHAEILSNRVLKNFKHFSKKYKKENIDCFRLFDWDTPDIRVVVDWYAGHIVVSEYEREQTGPEYVNIMAASVAKVLNVSEENVHVKIRRTKTEGLRYTRLDNKNTRFVANERDLKIYINPSDFLDTGLYSDHRNTRAIIQREVQDKDFLNLFAYTGVVSLAAAKGGARSVTTVDRNKTYIDWARDNFELNGYDRKAYNFIVADTFKFLSRAASEGRKYDMIFVDPPSFFNDEEEYISFDIKEDHPYLLKEVLKVAKKGSDIFFSTNHQRFVENFTDLNVQSIVKLTPKTIPEDYRNKNVHNCWRIKV